MMSKHTLLISLSFGLALVGLWDRLELGGRVPACSRFLLDPAELARQTKAVDDRLRAQKFLAEFQDGLLERLAQGKVSLPQACDQYFQFAIKIYPSFVHKLGAETKTTLKETIARRLVDFFRIEGEYTPSFWEMSLRLEQDLASQPIRDWCRQPWADEP